MANSNLAFRDLRFEALASLKPRERILKTAIFLFNEFGVHTVGIDRIIAESGVSKRSFYDYFPSKSDLISAYLDFWEMYRFTNLERHLSGVRGGARGEILAVFDALDEWISANDFRGCVFTRGLNEFNDSGSAPLRDKVLRHFEQFSEFIKIRLKQFVPSARAKVLLPQLMSLIVGSMVVANATGNKKVAQLNKALAKDLLGEYSE